MPQKVKKEEKKESPKLKKKYFKAIGRRKRATATVRLYSGKGKFLVNNKEARDYFSSSILFSLAKNSLTLTSNESKFDALINVSGGGMRGQAEAIRHGIARALLKYDLSLRPTLKKAGYLTRDPREKERKKYGYHKARRGRQFRKR